jgi:DUF4097 and DUF4098 domain-containing protein YvlB
MSTRIYVAMAAAVCLGLGLAAQAQSVNRSVEASAAGRVVITLVEGDVTVRGWNRAAVEVSGELGSAARDVELTRRGDETVLRVIEADEGAAETAARRETELVVSVPRGSSLVVNGTNADILIAGVEGTQSLHTVSGDIETESWSERIEAETVGGDVRVSGRGEAAEATLTTVAGEIEVVGSFRSLIASTVSGDIELDILDAALLSLNTTNGDIEVHATFDGQAELTAETINGDVELEVGEEGDLNLDIGTFSGRIENCFDDEQRGGRRKPGGELNVAADADSPRVRVRTLNGDIEICSS